MERVCKVGTDTKAASMKEEEDKDVQVVFFWVVTP
jgi:hypothetical protein